MELNEKLIFGTVLRSTDESEEYGICRKCARFKTDACPNAARCFSTLHKPYFESMGNCITLEDTNGNRKLYKQRHDKKIDAVAALMDAYVAWKLNRDAFE